jgi:hypothetical protein
MRQAISPRFAIKILFMFIVAIDSDPDEVIRGFKNRS